MHMVNLARTRDAVAAAGPEYRQALWFWPDGAPACVGAHAITACSGGAIPGSTPDGTGEDYAERPQAHAPGVGPGEAADVAQALLGLTAAEREAMFDPDPTPGEAFEPTAEVAVAMLERAIAEGVVRWRDKPNGAGIEGDAGDGWQLPVLEGTAGNKHFRIGSLT